MAAERPTPTPKRMGEAERRVVDAFVAWLQSEGWQTWTEVDYLDALAERDGQWLRAEAKSHTGERPEHPVRDRVPPASLSKVVRVSARVRDLLRVDVYSVDPDTGFVELVPSHSD